MDADGRWAVVAISVMIEFLDDVEVVSSAFDHTRVGPIPTGLGASFVDLVECFG